MLRVRIKEEAVRTYLLTNCDHYDSMDLGHICLMFDMDESLCRKIISRMIFNKVRISKLFGVICLFDIAL
jgi:translation initiation factor 3 subunit C